MSTHNAGQSRGECKQVCKCTRTREEQSKVAITCSVDVSTNWGVRASMQAHLATRRKDKLGSASKYVSALDKKQEEKINWGVRASM